MDLIGRGLMKQQQKKSLKKAELVRSNHIGDVYAHVGRDDDKWKISTGSDKMRGFSEIARACTYPNFWSA